MTTRDTSGIRCPPPLWYAGAFVVGYAVDRFVPARLGTAAGAAHAAGWVLVVVSLLLVVGAAVVFWRAGTTPNPMKPTTALVMHGFYRFTRNPMYLGLALLYLGGVLLVDSLWPLVVFPVAIALVDAQLHPVARVEAKTIVVVAAKVGRTRLIDNVILGEGIANDVSVRTAGKD